MSTGSITFSGPQNITGYVGFYDQNQTLLGTNIFDIISNVPKIPVPSNTGPIYIELIVLSLASDMTNLYSLYQPMIIPSGGSSYDYSVNLLTTILPNTQFIPVTLFSGAYISIQILISNINKYVSPESATSTCRKTNLGNESGTQNKNASAFICVDNRELKNIYTDTILGINKKTFYIAFVVIVIILIIIICVIIFLIVRGHNKKKKQQQQEEEDL